MQRNWALRWHSQVFIGEAITIDGLSASTVTTGCLCVSYCRTCQSELFTEVAALDPERWSQLGNCLVWEGVDPHEALDDTVELGALVARTRITESQSSEVLRGLGDSLLLEFCG